MSHTVFRFLAVLAIALTSTAVLAQGKVAVVDPQAALVNTNLAKELFQKKSEDPEFAKLNSTYESLRADLQAMAQQAQANSASWTPEQAAEHQKQMQYKQADLQLAANKIDAEQQEVLMQLEQRLSGPMNTAVNELIQSEGIGLLIDRQAALYVDPSLSITAKLVAKLNEATAAE